MTKPQTILFLGATGGCGFGTLRRSIAAGHTCIALCRTPSRLTNKLPASQRDAPNLHIEEGNALDRSTVARLLVRSTSTGSKSVVDTVVFTLGGVFQPSKFANDDPHVCENAMKTLLDALSDARKTTGATGATGHPRIVAISSTGLSTHGRDYPLALWPLYHIMLKGAHADKRAMETLLVESGEAFVIVRPSLLKDAPDPETVSEKAAVKSPIRVGVEDPRVGRLESKEVGYTITRDDVGRWIFEEILSDGGEKWTGKIVSVTH
ncbi:hypothetical protein VPNG_07033 [Cytospora leucostoma]|uniref:NAD(P)-binding domain-containing protein n=1 Tax=Cytospora leucostoma TaxID=1230097 RepID=A0A423WNI6_9PEZI|nr:hypothetical protein VPNG_07033 [Cytospora leucostoma]